MMLYVVPPLETGARSLQATAPGTSARETATLKEYEHLFLFQLIKEMRKTVPKDGLFERNSQQLQFEEMLDDYWAGEMADSGQLGVAREMAAQLHLQQTGSPVNSTNSLATTGTNPAGIPLHKAHSGMALSKNKTKGLSLPTPPHAIPLPVTKGIPLKRGNSTSSPLKISANPPINSVPAP